MPHEVLLALSPVDEEILGQEHRDDHADAVVHPAGLGELPHPGVDDRKSVRPAFHASNPGSFSFQTRASSSVDRGDAGQTLGAPIRTCR